MAAGCPVVSSPGGALRENLEGAAELVEPEDEDGWVATLARLLTDQSLRSRLVAAGQQRASRFSWTETAQQTLAVYEAALGECRTT